MKKDKYDYSIENGLVIVDEDGTIYKKYSNGKFKKAPQHKSENGYKIISLRVNGKQWNLYSHRIIAKYFIPNPENKPIVNHKDGNRANNNISNLEWCTLKENSQHARKTNQVYQKAKCIYCNSNTRVGYELCAKCRYEIAKAERRKRKKTNKIEKEKLGMLKLIEKDHSEEKVLMEGYLDDIVQYLKDNDEIYTWILDEDPTAEMPCFDNVEVLQDLEYELAKVDLSWWSLEVGEIA